MASREAGGKNEEKIKQNKKVHKVQRQGPGHLAPETKESQRQRARRQEEEKIGDGGGAPPESNQQPGRQHNRGESARRAEKREANRTNNTQHQGPGHPGPETKESKRQRGRARQQQRKEKKDKREGGRVKRGPRKKQPQPGVAKQSRKTKRPKGKLRRTRTRPGGRPAEPGQEGRAHAHMHGTRAWRPPTCKGGCRRPHETAPVHRPSPPSNDRRYRKPYASVTGSTHANHCSARSPRPTPEGPARDNPIAGPRTGTTRSELNAPASAGASGRHNGPGSRPASACPAQPPSKAGGASPRGWQRHHGFGKANRSPEGDRTERDAVHQAGPRSTPERHAAGHNQDTRTGAKQRRPPGAANPESAHNTQRTTVRGHVPSDPSHRPDRRVRAQQRTQPLPATEQLPSGLMRVRLEGTQPLPATNSGRPDGRVSTPQRRPAHATHSTTHRGSTPVNRSQVAQDTAQHTGRAHR